MTFPTASPRSAPPASEIIAPVALAAAALLDQCASLIQSADARCYCGESATIRGGTLGKHVRHVLDHFRAALDAADDPSVEIDYDHRERNVPMETDRAAALDSIRELRDRLAAVTPAMVDRPVRVRVMITGDGAEAALGSTLGRELAFAAHHAVHHHAMMGAIAAEFGVRTHPEFGKAPSTINFDRSGQ
ncbi:MAG: hypothetical protein JNM80_02740 [Phycisphaerae bacterium]|nr:hypothetical protein [Phycisphaerae bacterium]